MQVVMCLKEAPCAARRVERVWKREEVSAVMPWWGEEGEGGGEVRLFIKRLWEKVDTEGFGAGLRREGESRERGGRGGRGAVGIVEMMVLIILSNSISQIYGIRRSFTQPICCTSPITSPPGTKLAFVIFK